MHTVTYEEAAKILGVSLGTIQHAVPRGVLTKMPRQGVMQRLIKEQVELFKGKKLSLSSLSDTENKLWRAYSKYASGSTEHTGETVSGREVPQGTPFLVAKLIKSLKTNIRQGTHVHTGYSSPMGMS